MSPRAHVAAFGAAAVGIVLTVWLFWPGFTSVDSAYQYAQAQAHRYDNIHPPLMAWLWHYVDHLWAGSGGWFALVTILAWIGLAATVSLTIAAPRTRALVVLVVGLWPPTLLMLGHVWKDVALLALLLWAAALTFHWHRRGNGWSRLGGFVLLALATALRHNAFAAVLPLLAMLAYPARARSPFQRPAWRPHRAALLRFVLGAAVLFAVPMLIERALVHERKAVWPMVALWDLSAVSIASDEMLLPRSLVAPDLDVETLRRHYRSWSSGPLFDSNQIRLSFFVPYTDAESTELRQAWLRAMREHPLAWLGHRLRMTGVLLFGAPADAPRELTFVPEHRLDGTPLREPAPLRALLALAESTRHSVLFGAAPALLLALLVAALAARGRHWPALVLALSALVYAAPLAFLAASAEYRFVLWTVVASMLSAAILLAAPPPRHKH